MTATTRRDSDLTPPAPGSRERTPTARVLGGIGRVAIGLGALILLFVVYQLWGTGLRTARAQSELRNDFEAASQLEADRQSSGRGTVTAPVPDPIAPPAPGRGEAVGRLEVPAIDLDWIFLEGVDLEVLKDGPGHYEGTPLPGEAGNASIAGHRTTYGQPFHNIDQIGAGDRIVITYANGARFAYEYERTDIVSPDRVDVLDDYGDNRLTLTACHPKFSAAERIIVTALLLDEPAPSPPAPSDDGGPEPVPPEPALTNLDGASSSRLPTLAWGFGVLAVGLGTWLLARRWNRWLGYLVGAPAFLVVLFLFFESVSRLLPAAY